VEVIVKVLAMVVLVVLLVTKYNIVGCVEGDGDAGDHTFLSL
jgi:hypothetical protein